LWIRMTSPYRPPHLLHLHLLLNLHLLLHLLAEEFAGAGADADAVLVTAVVVVASVSRPEGALLGLESVSPWDLRPAKSVTKCISQVFFAIFFYSKVFIFGTLYGNIQ
jgi:hypothetical protein